MLPENVEAAEGGVAAETKLSRLLLPSWHHVRDDNGRFNGAKVFLGTTERGRSIKLMTTVWSSKSS